jgi:hypothetical protein
MREPITLAARVVLPLAAPLAGARREEGSELLPLLVGKLVSFHPK